PPSLQPTCQTCLPSGGTRRDGPSRP
ncbi:dis3-like exonuclease 2-like, partial [Nannochloropsis oceanica]